MKENQALSGIEPILIEYWLKSQWIWRKFLLSTPNPSSVTPHPHKLFGSLGFSSCVVDATSVIEFWNGLARRLLYCSSYLLFPVYRVPYLSLFSCFVLPSFPLSLFCHSCCDYPMLDSVTRLSKFSTD